MTMPGIYLATKESPSAGNEYVRILVTWNELSLLTEALHHYCFTARPGYRELTPGLGEHTFALHHVLDQYCRDLTVTDTRMVRFSSLFPVYVTVRVYRVVTELLCLYVDSSLTAGQLEAKQTLEAKLEAIEFAVAIVEAGETLQSVQ